MGMRRAPIRFILLEFERIEKMPREIEVMKTRRPRKEEKKRTRERRIIRTAIERYL